MDTRICFTVALAVFFTSFCLAEPIPGDLAAPVMTSVNLDGDQICFEWTADPNAVKYSVDLEGTVAFVADANDVAIDIELSFGTSDRTDGADMSEPFLCVDTDVICSEIAAILAELEYNPASYTLDGFAKVKALNPGKGKGRQNNPFSEPVAIPTLSCQAALE